MIFISTVITIVPLLRLVPCFFCIDSALLTASEWAYSFVLLYKRIREILDVVTF